MCCSQPWRGSPSGAGARLAVELGAPWLVASGLTKIYGGVVALADASMELRAGEIRGLVGANGAGKSTLVKILTGLTPPTEGTVQVDGLHLRLGKPKESLRAGIVAVPQELTVAPTMTVAENIMMGHYPLSGPGFFGRARCVARRKRCSSSWRSRCGRTTSQASSR